MDEISGMSSSIRRRRERRIWRGGLLLSVLVHTLVFALWRGPVPVPDATAAAGPDRGGERAAAGGLQALNLTFPETPAVITPPPVPIAVVAEVEPVQFDDVPSVDPASFLGEAPGIGEGPGLEDGTGEGNAGDAESGSGGLRPPAPQGMIIPPTHPDLRGEIQVWVFVDVRGRVVPDSTRLEPPTRNGDLNDRLIREAAEWRFRPAMRDGAPVAAWFPYRIIM